MTKEELFEKYSIDESHSAWTRTDSWYSVEIFRFMHDGRLPTSEDRTTEHLIKFLDGMNENKLMPKLVEYAHSQKLDWGSFYLTAKRMVYAFWEQIIEELGAMAKND